MIVALPDKPWQVALIDQDKGNMIDVKVNLFEKKSEVTYDVPRSSIHLFWPQYFISEQEIRAVHSTVGWVLFKRWQVWPVCSVSGWS